MGFIPWLQKHKYWGSNTNQVSMPHSYNRIWIHATWATKDRRKIIHSSFEREMYSYMYNQFKQCGCAVKIINDAEDHVHCLFLLNPSKSVTEVIKQVKGSTSHFINAGDFNIKDFAWQNGYGSFSASESVTDYIASYIENQKHHHKRKTYDTEFAGLLAENHIEPMTNE